MSDTVMQPQSFFMVTLKQPFVTYDFSWSHHDLDYQNVSKHELTSTGF